METITFRTSNNTTLTALNLGPVAAGSSDDQALRLSNNSDTYQAQDVTVSVHGSDATQLWLSTGDDMFAPAIDVGDIAPGSTSAVFWLRRVTAASATGAAGATLTARPASWTIPADPAAPTVGLETSD